MSQSVSIFSINWRLAVSGRFLLFILKYVKLFFLCQLQFFIISKLRHFKKNPTIIIINQIKDFAVSLFIGCHLYCHIGFTFFAGVEIDIMELITSMNIMEILNARLKSFSQKVFTYLLKPMLKFQKLVKVHLNHFFISNIQVGAWDVRINRSII